MSRHDFTRPIVAMPEGYERAVQEARQAAQQYARKYLVLSDGTRVNRRVWLALETNWLVRLPLAEEDPEAVPANE